MRALTHTWIHASATTLLTLVIVALAVPQIASAQLSVRRPVGRMYSAPFSLVDSGQRLGSFSSWTVSLADADGDRDLDAFVSNWHPSLTEYSRLWLNGGDGTFRESAQQFPAGQTTMSLGDLDDDGDIDIWYGGHIPNGQADGQVWLNDGGGRFSRTDQRFLTGNNSIGDLDGDGDLDAMVVNYLVGVRVYLNDGSARFLPIGGDLHQPSPGNLALGDLDGDGDIDAYVTSTSDDSFVSLPDRVWLNDGSARLTDSGQSIGSYQGISVSLGDVDGDGDVDALVGNAHDAPDAANPSRPFKLYLNDGGAHFSDSEQNLGEAKEGAVSLADMDLDGDLDAVLSSRDPMTESGFIKVLINNGRGRFADWGIESEGPATPGVSVGDVDGDGDPDVFVAHVLAEANRVLVNIRRTSSRGLNRSLDTTESSPPISP